MRFIKTIAIVAISTVAATAAAQDGSTLRTTETTTTTTTVVQPTTVVESTPASDSKAEQMRRARQNAEIQTEQKIVEKLEESRLKEETERAQRLFGDKIDAQPAATATTAPAAGEVKKDHPTVHIEKVEIITAPKGEEKPANGTVAAPVVAPVTTPAPAPTAEIAPVTAPAVTPAPAPAPVVTEAAPVATPVLAIEKEEAVEEVEPKKFFVSGILAVPSYQASNIKSNYGLGVSAGIFTGPKWSVEGTFLYMNSSVDTFWDPQGIYRNLDQYDLQAAARYYLMEGDLRPFVGGSVTYIYRKYDDRVKEGDAWWTNQETHQEETHAVNMGILAGVDFAINRDVMIGGGIDYNWNIMNNSDFYSSYNVPTGTKKLEEIEYWTLKLDVKYRF